MPDGPTFLTSLLAGGVAGTTTDVALFPLDTIKTRMQSPQGFLKSGGFRGVYKGLSAAAVGSAPGAAIFFSTYEMSKQYVSATWPGAVPASVVHMGCASVGEVAACLVRVPTEVVKQRMQAGLHASMASAVSSTLKAQGILGLYQGFGITIMREIPFSLIQFPLYEFMKAEIRSSRGNGTEPHAYESAVCGSLSGALAAALTTPLDVLKTRLMLGADAQGRPYLGPLDTLRRVLQEGHANTAAAAAAAAGKGGSALSAAAAPGKSAAQLLFSGVEPRVMWIGIGGFVFFGAYEAAKGLLLGL